MSHGVAFGAHLAVRDAPLKAPELAGHSDLSITLRNAPSPHRGFLEPPHRSSVVPGAHAMYAGAMTNEEQRWFNEKEDVESHDEWLKLLARAPSQIPTDDLIGDVLDGKYRVDGFLGRGGMGIVLRATHLGTRREVALKVLVPELTLNDSAVERFKREARTAGSLRHPNVVDVTDFGFDERGSTRLAYLVMELLRGQTLRELLARKGALNVEAALDVVEQVCAGVTEAHVLGILHRDLKPENIHLEPRLDGGYRVRVLDFGIAKLVEPQRAPARKALRSAQPIASAESPEGLAVISLDSSANSLTEVGARVGTPRYMSPEQWTGGAADVRSDIYSIGLIAHEIFTGSLPRSDASTWALVRRAKFPPSSVRGVRRTIGSEIEKVIASALARDPSARPTSARHLAEALRAASESSGNVVWRSIVLGASHYGLLARRYAPCWVPAVAIETAGFLCWLFARFGWLPTRVDSTVSMALGMVGTPLYFLLEAPAIGLLVPLIADLAAGRRTQGAAPSTSEFWSTLRCTWPSTAVGMSILWATGTLARAVASSLATRAGPHAYTLGVAVAGHFSYLVLATAFTSPFVLYAPVAAVERARGLGPLRRSAALVRPIRRTAFAVQFISILAFQLSLLLIVLAGMQLTGIQYVDSYVDTDVSAALFARAFRLVAVLLLSALAPFMIAAPGLLYLRARALERTPTIASRGGGSP